MEERNQGLSGGGVKRDTRALALRVITFLGGIYFFLYFITPESIIEGTKIKSAHEAISNGFIAVSSMAIGLGVINILMTHGSKFIFLKRGWQYSAALLLGLLVMIGSTLAHWMMTRHSASQIRDVQIIGDFAARILEDAKLGAGNERSFSPTGVPELSKRVSALESYSLRIIEKIKAEEFRIIEIAQGDLATTQLIRDSEQELLGLRESVSALLGNQWNTLDATNQSALAQVSQRAAKVASSYAILKRKENGTKFSSRLYDFLYDGLFNHLGASMFALLGVYIAAAAYRAFRIQTIESGLMMAAALVVMLGQISFGKVIYEDMPSIRQWLLEVPNSAAFRAIRLGAGVAGLMLAIRMWLSIESAKSGGDKK
jgi:hypothetical protein